MNWLLKLTVVAAAAAGFGAGAMAAPPPTLVRGTVSSLSGSQLIITSYSGKPIDVRLDSDTKYAWVTKSSLSAIKSGDFIGTAATGPTNDLKALEVVIFPASMRGAGEGHYSWNMPAAVASADANGKAGTMNSMPPAQSSMTNGTVSSMTNGSVSGSMTNGSVSGSMTNGSVSGSMTNGSVSNGNGRTLTVSYNNGKSVTVMVPASAPVVKFDPASQSILKPGVKVFIKAGGKTSGGEPKAAFVAAGKNGLMPPM